MRHCNNEALERLKSQNKQHLQILGYRLSVDPIAVPEPHHLTPPKLSHDNRLKSSF